MRRHTAKVNMLKKGSPMSLVDRLTKTEKTPRQLYEEQVWPALQKTFGPKFLEAQDALLDGSLTARPMIANYQQAIASITAAGGTNAAEEALQLFQESLKAGMAHGLYMNKARQMSFFDESLDGWMRSLGMSPNAMPAEQRRDLKEYIFLQDKVRKFERTFAEEGVGIGGYEIAEHYQHELMGALVPMFGGNMELSHERIKEMRHAIMGMDVMGVADPIARAIGDEWIDEHHWDIKQLTKSLPENARDTPVVTNFIREVVRHTIIGGSMPERSIFSFLEEKSSPPTGPVHVARDAAEKLLGQRACARLEKNLRDEVTDKQLGFVGRG